MRNEARLIVLAEWAARTNDATRAVMGVRIEPLSDYSPPPDDAKHRARREAHVCFDGLMSDAESTARVAADRAWVRSLGERPRDDYEGLSWSFAAACRAADEKQRSKPVDPATERLRALLRREVTLERAQAEVSKRPQIPIATLQAAEFLLQQKDPAQMRRWLARHTAAERKAILQHLEQRKTGGGGNG